MAKETDGSEITAIDVVTQALTTTPSNLNDDQDVTEIREDAQFNGAGSDETPAGDNSGVSTGTSDGTGEAQSEGSGDGESTAHAGGDSERSESDPPGGAKASGTDEGASTESQASGDTEHTGDADRKSVDDATGEDGEDGASSTLSQAEQDKADDAVFSNLSKKGQRRVKSLRARVTTAEQQAERYRQQAVNEQQATAAITSKLREYGLHERPDLIEQALNTQALISSNDPTRLRAGRDLLAQQLSQLNLRLGDEAPAVDPLASHPDLLRQVDGLDIERSSALQIAAERQRRQDVEQQNARISQQNQAAEQAQQQRLHHGKRVGSMIESWMRNDPGFRNKQTAIQEYVTELAQKMQPHEWETAMQLKYNSMLIAEQDALQQRRAEANREPGSERAAAGSSPGAAPNPMDAENLGSAVQMALNQSRNLR